MTKPDDSELERYLAGDHPVSRHYHDAADDAPPAALDAAIRQQAHAAVADESDVSNRRRRWWRPVAAAAVLVLGVGLVFELQRQPEIRQATIPASSTQAEVATPKQSRGGAAPSAAPRAAPAPESATRPRFKAQAEPMLQAPAAADRVQVQHPIDKQIGRIRQLLESGKRDKAVAALKRLLESRPDAALPDELARLATEEDLKP